MVKKFIALLLLSIGPIRALTIFEFLGGQKIGTTTMAFLKIPVGAKQGALGETGVAIAYDATCAYWNPSAISFIPARKSIALFSQRWIADAYYTFGGTVLEFGKYFRGGIIVGNLHSGYIQRTDEYHPFGLGTFYRVSSSYIGISLSRKLIDRFSFGVSFKYLSEILDDYVQYTVAMDLGTFYLIGYRDLSLGISISNIGPDPILKSSNPEETPMAFSLPVIYRLGFYGSPFATFYVSAQLEKSTDNVEIFRIGGEYIIAEILALRFGYRLNANLPGEYSGFTGGIGIIKSIGYKKDIHIDYAVTSMGYAGLIHKAQMGVNF